MKTRPYHHGDLRAALLDRAEQTLRRKGPDGLSLRELAREVGVSPGAPSHHFKGRQALLDALALEGYARLTSALTGVLEQAGDSFADRLAALARAYVAFATANAALLDLMYGHKHETTAPEELTAATQRLAALGTQLIEDGQRRGEIRQGPANRAAIPLTAALQGLTALALSGTLSAEQIEEGLVETTAVLLRGYAP
ncbi:MULTISPECIES: TetR/AcrR family transcriptional regulator [Streptomyces]|uniref:TetR/AcrR family transcriptional regulator n=1 Tax=Streptomyces TaxID=1883 RepID=UPI0033DCD46C